MELDGAWVAVQVRPRSERVVGAQLENGGYEYFLPLYETEQRGRGTPSAAPLFPGYVFCRYMVANPHQIVRLSAVVRLVGTSRGPVPVPDEEIDAIRRVSGLQLRMEPWRGYAPGQRVRVVTGPLAGIEGLLVGVRNRWKLLLTVTLLQQGVAVEVRACDVEAAAPRRSDLRAAV